jgi:hypothetical protein
MRRRSLPRTVRRAGGRLLLVLAGITIALVLIEAGLEIGLRHPPGWGAGPINGALRRVHLASEWPMIQYSRDCARWDPDVTYTLRPPGCTVRDREFVVRYDVNRAGLRDDDISLIAPEIIVLGDSYAMGWGVAQRESFPELLERRLGRRVLDAGVSSYGTARELALLARLDRSNLRALVLQYCWNDNEENREWVAHGGHLTTLSQDDYARLVEQQTAALRYYPFKHLITLLGVLWQHWAPAAVGIAFGQADEPVAAAVGDLLATLAGHRALLGDVPVVILVTCEHESAVATAIREQLDGGRWPELGSLVSVVDPAPAIRGEDIYPLDGHWTPAGHRLAADLLQAELARRGVR